MAASANLKNEDNDLISNIEEHQELEIKSEDHSTKRYGLDEGTLNQTASTEVNRYEQAHMYDYLANHSIGWRDPGFIHDGVMKGLENGKRYYYKVSNCGISGTIGPVHIKDGPGAEM